MTAPQRHVPVLLERTIDLLEPALRRDGAVLVDATLGLGGHSEAFLERFPWLSVIGLDRDPVALRLAGERLARFGDRVTLVHCVYDELDHVVREAGRDSVDAILFDLGVSSMQLDDTDRGFSYSQDVPLDMRMDPGSELTAERIVAEYSEAELRRVFWDYGEERLAPRYARRIVRERETAPIVSSARLVEILTAATPQSVARSGHPAKRVFQALRIEVNQELAVLERAVPRALDVLSVHGRIVVLSYQSLEDRIVKRALSRASSSSAPAGLPVELPEHLPRFALLVRGAERASEDEMAANPRATPVRLRAAERVRSAA